MKRENTIWIACVLLLIGITGQSALGENQKPKNRVPAKDLRIINKAFDDTERLYSRLPVDLRDSIQPGRSLWNRQECSSGIGVRFATDSPYIGAEYTLLWDTHMLHMADTGLKGTDLYILDSDSTWRHVNTNRPNVLKDAKGNKTKKVAATYASDIVGGMHEYIIYMPLYDGVLDDFTVVVDSGYTITKGREDLIDAGRRIVAYGTSILQGGCASRTGMAATNILGRELNCEVMNLGFSGEGKMDSYMSHAMARIPDVDVFIIDPVPNCTEMMCDTLTYGFVKILRNARPEVPIVMVEGPLYPYSRYTRHMGEYLPKKNLAYRRNYERLIAENPENLYYVTAEGLDGIEDDGTVDGIHLTDLGFRHYADKLKPLLARLLCK